MAALQTEHELQELIEDAVKKINGEKENDICRFIPVSTGGYIHHFTLKKMMTENPSEVKDMIKKYIINVNIPQAVTPKKRAPRGSRKRKDQLLFSKHEIERLYQMARKFGDDDLSRKLMSRSYDLATIKRELIASVKHSRIDQDLWNAYVELVTIENDQHSKQENI